MNVIPVITFKSNITLREIMHVLQLLQIFIYTDTSQLQLYSDNVIYHIPFGNNYK